MLPNANDIPTGSGQHSDASSPRKRSKPFSKSSSMSHRTAAQATRTSRACDGCRKQKTRCLPPTNESAGCSRCQFLNINCSFMVESGSDISTNASQTDRLFQIHQGVNEILHLLKANKPSEEVLGLSKTLKDIVESQDVQHTSESPQDFRHPSKSSKSSPFSIVTNLFSDDGVPNPIFRLVSRPQKLIGNRDMSKPDIVTLGIVDEAEAVELLDYFKQNYGRWVLFPSNITTIELIKRIRQKSPLLLTTCCCVSLRYLLNNAILDLFDVQQDARQKNEQLLTQLAKELEDALVDHFLYPHGLTLTGDVEFLQALAVLSIYSLSISSVATNTSNYGSTNVLSNFGLDPWYLLSVGLNTFLSKSAFGHLIQPQVIDAATSPFTILFHELDDEEQTLTVLRIYNHLTIVHLIHCVFSGRMCVLDEVRLNYCTATLSLAKLTNFDGRVVSEIEVLLIAYNYIQIAVGTNDKIPTREKEAAFTSVMDEMKQWYDQWEYLFTQPTVQYVLLCYEFCYIVIILVYEYQKNNDVTMHFDEIYSKENLETVLGRCSGKSLISILEHAKQLLQFENMVDNDSYFAFLSDQIHFCFYFAGLVYMKTYESLLKTHLVDMKTEKGTFQHIKDLVSRFTRVSQGLNQDLLLSYQEGLQEILLSVRATH